MNILKLPKIELHCHLDGSVRAETIIDIAKKEGVKLPSFNIDDIKKAIIAPLNCKSLDEYLSTFAITNSVMQSKESLRRITYELFEDAAKENVKYMEVRFAPILHIEKGLTMEEIIEAVIQGMREAENKYEIKGNLILGCMRNMSIDKAFETVEAGKAFLGKGVVAIDLCGPELEGFSYIFVDAITLAKNYGYRVTIHAGETGIGKNVLEAVEVLGAERIGHGVFIRDYMEAYDIVKNKGVILEMCPTSNVQTKAVKDFKDHPIYDYFKDGIKVTVNTDNRSVSNINLTNEVEIINSQLNVSLEDYKIIYNNSLEGTFADKATKSWLKTLI